MPKFRVVSFFLLLFLNAVVFAGADGDKVDKAVERGLGYLAARQKSDGSFGAPETPYGTDPAVTALCGLAFLSDGDTPNRGKYGGKLARIADYLLGVVQENGLIEDPRNPSPRPMYGQGYGITFLCEVYGMYEHEGFKEKLRNAVDLIIETQGADGGWRYRPIREPIADTSVTSCQLVALRAAKNAGFYVPNEVIEKAVAFILKAQNNDGGFRYLHSSDDAAAGHSAFARSAASLLALQCGGVYEGEVPEKGFEYLAKFSPPNNPGGHFHYGHYYAVTAIWCAGEKCPIKFEKWFAAVSLALVQTQQPDGSWNAKNGEMPADCATAMSCIILRVPKQHIPSMQK